MKKKVTAAVLTLGLTLSASAGVYAGSNLQEIRASLNSGLSLIVNGTAFTPTDGNGKALAPITYKGTTYLPVRSIGDALDTSVTYDAKNSRVVIGSTATTPSTTAPAPTTPPPKTPSTTTPAPTTPSTTTPTPTTPSTTTPAPTTPSTTSQRPQHIPADFPLPADAKIFDLVEGVAGGTGTPSATFRYTTKQDLLSLGNQYKQYFVQKGATSKSEQVSASAFTIVNAGSSFSVTLDAKPGTGNNQGFNVIDVVWSGK
ncbi:MULTISPECIES: stalk domain-containing protein [Saccharibacillus]|uniref:stalk domain-containing protein n=1 Tax=Saccharibacillus TaxID=456492 RepID=UPI00123AA733|nr:hypothetical protein [Saccharibacillus sp. WB 17]MWJ32678.1 hypothetical protein [Saccharibacillus sp. WB 17]